MNVVFLVAAERGLRCLKSAFMYLDASDTVTVFTFRETDWEPRLDEVNFKNTNCVPSVLIKSVGDTLGG